MGAIRKKVPPDSHRAEGPDLEQDLRELRSLLERSRVEEARALVKELEQKWPDSQEVGRAARVLAPPRVLPSRPDINARPRDRERAWLREHAREYPGCWVALVGDRLIAADPKLRTVLAVLREAPDGDEALLHFQPDPSV
jgi:hypothetical protein